jgi:hypothetical protein
MPVSPVIGSGLTYTQVSLALTISSGPKQPVNTQWLIAGLRYDVTRYRKTVFTPSNAMPRNWMLYDAEHIVVAVAVGVRVPVAVEVAVAVAVGVRVTVGVQVAVFVAVAVKV